MRRPNPAALLLPLPFLAACQGTSAVLEESEKYAQLHQHHQAYWILEQARERHPNDPALEEMFWQRRRAYLVEEGTRLIYAEREHLGIRELEKALAIAPQDAQALAMIETARRKLARRAILQGNAFFEEGELTKALQAYHQALGYIPQEPEAEAGVRRVNKHFVDRHRKAANHAEQAAELYDQGLLRQSLWHYQLAHDHDPSRKEVQESFESVAGELADLRMERARDLARQGLHGAAYLDYQEAEHLLSLEEHPDLEAATKSAERRLEVRLLCDQADMLIRKGELEQAETALKQARAWTEGGAAAPETPETQPVTSQPEAQEAAPEAHEAPEAEGGHPPAGKRHQALSSLKRVRQLERLLEEKRSSQTKRQDLEP